MEKKLIKFNEHGYKSRLSELSTVVNISNTSIEKMKDVLEVELTENLVIDLLDMGGQKLKTLVLENVKTQLHKAGITSSAIVSNLMQVEANKFDDLIKGIQKVSNLDLKYTEIQNGKLAISEKSKIMLKEEFCIYVENNKEEELFELHKNFINSANKLLNSSKLLKRKHVIELLGLITDNPKEAFVLDPGMLNYKMFAE